MADIVLRTDGSVFDVRSAGFLVRDGKILVQREKDGDEYALPGGHVQMGETTANALVREYQEETGADIRCERLLWTEECFWEWNGCKHHNLTYYYLIALNGGSDIPDDGVFVPHRDNSSVVIGWMPIDRLSDIVIYPEFLKRTIYELDGPPAHFITR